MVTRRSVAIALGASALTTPYALFAQSQTTRIARIGFLHAGAPVDNPDWRVEAFLGGMRELGYVEGKNLQFELRWANGMLERLSALAGELVKLNVDVIVTVSSPAVRAALSVTRTTPIVMAGSSDPVSEGFAASLARPGGNVTGLSVMSSELGDKRMQLLKEIYPKVVHPVAVLWNPASTGMQKRYEQAEAAANVLRIGVRSVQARNASELESAFNAIQAARCDALLLMLDPMTHSQRERIVRFAAEKRLPAIYESSTFVDAGGLISYGPLPTEAFRRSAYFVDRILKGTKPADLPIEQPTRFELAVNLKTAKALGITVPPSIMVLATKVIQ